MALIALVLALALGMQVFYIYRSEYADLQKTMGLILEPWRSAGEEFRPQGERPQEDRPPPEGEASHPPERQRIGDKRIVTVFYDRTAGEMRIMPEDRPIDRESVTAAV